MRSPVLLLILLIASANAASSIIACTKKDGATISGASSSSPPPASKDGAGDDNVPCKDDSNKTLANGKISSCILSKDFTIDGYECIGGKMIELYGGAPQGKLKGCYLKAPKVIDGWSCQDGLSLYSSGKLRRCKVTVAKSAADRTEVRAGDWVTVYDGGGIKRLELAVGPNKVQGYPCKGYLNFFHENGKLKKCELSEDTTIEGKKVNAKTDAGTAVFVCFDEKGKRVLDCNTLSGMTLD